MLYLLILIKMPVSLPAAVAVAGSACRFFCFLVAAILVMDMISSVRGLNDPVRG